MLNPIYFDMGTCVNMFEQRFKLFKIVHKKYFMEKGEAMTLLTHLFAYSY